MATKEAAKHSPGAERAAAAIIQGVPAAALIADVIAHRWADIISRETSDIEMIGALKEAREVCAACFRVINEAGEASVDMLENELHRLLIKDGFGVRWQDLIAKAEGR